MTDDQADDPGGPAPNAIGRLAHAAWQRRWLVAFCLVAGLALAVLAHAQKTPTYQSSTQVLVVKKQSNALPVAGGDPRLTVIEDYVSTHLVLVRSPLVIERAVKKRQLGGLRSFAGQDPVAAIRAGLAADREKPKDAGPSAVPNNNIINLTFAGPDPGDAEAVLNAVVDSYRDFLDETYRNVSDNTLDLITRAGNLLRTDIAEKERKYREFRRASPLLLRGADGATVHASRVLELQRKETGLLERAAELRERLKAVEKAKADGKPEAVLVYLATRPLDRAAAAPDNEQALEKTLFPLLIEEKKLLQTFGPDHPDVVRVREQIAMTRDLFKRLDTISKQGDEAGRPAASDRLDAVVQALQSELALVETTRTGLTNLLKDEVTEARKLEAFEIQDKAFVEDIARTNKVLDETLKRLEQINLVRDFGGFDARVITAPAPGVKVGPLLWRALLAGGMLGLLAGFGWAVLIDVLDKSFRTPEEIRRRLGLPIIGHVPYQTRDGDPVCVAGAGGEAAELDAGLDTVHRPMSPEAEAYRGVRTALYFNTHGGRHKVVQVTSPNMGDGKTTLITNLAVSVAQSGRRVLLIDADLRRPRVHRVFDVPGKVGLAEVIGGAAELSAAVRPTVVPGLDVLPCGRRPPNPAELLTSPRFEEVLEDVRDGYDFVLVDTPPLLAVSDPCAVAPRVDGVVLTIRVARNGRPAAERARALLAGLKARVLGVVVNGVGREGAMTGYGYEHYRYADEYAVGYAAADDDPPAEERETVAEPQAEPTPAPSANGHPSVNGRPAD
jgi:capsular exopolysaccharide synthesis family protein